MRTRNKGGYYRNSARETREINQVDLKLLESAQNHRAPWTGRHTKVMNWFARGKSFDLSNYD